MRFTFESKSLAETQRLGAALADISQRGMVLGLVGTLGAGKTQLVKAMAEAWGVAPSEVTSPTFVLIQEYQGDFPIYHFDAYRIGDQEEFLALGSQELMAGDGVCLIEWANLFPDALPEDALWIEIEQTAPDSRRFEIHGTGEKPEQVIQDLKKALKHG